MMVYRAPTRVVDTSQLAQITDPQRRLIEFGEVEAALADELFPERDGLIPRLLLKDVPHRLIRVPVAEGYAYYGLFPETYAESAWQFWREIRPPEVVVIGLRGIGTSLSSVVQSTLENLGVRVHSFTVRPRGHPFDRELRITSELAETWRSLGHSFFAIVDEGPGLSGSSFCGSAEKLSELGIPDERIVFFASWEGNAEAFRSERARRRWTRHRKYAAQFSPPADAIDLSAGKWRDVLNHGQCLRPENNPQHEARKYLVGPVFRKFAGLGPYTAQKWQRAQQLSADGFAPPAIRHNGGFIDSEVVLGGADTPVCASRVAEYLAFRYRYFQTGQAADYQPLAEMIEVNTGRPPEVLPPPAPAVIVDGRLQRHEWIGTYKTDALDHGDNHFFPGPTDIAWDVAGASIELGLDVTEQYACLSGDRGIGARLPFYKLAYAAFRHGYRTMFGLTA